jgi:hypothetical protein
MLKDATPNGSRSCPASSNSPLLPAPPPRSARRSLRGLAPRPAARWEQPRTIASTRVSLPAGMMIRTVRSKVAGVLPLTCRGVPTSPLRGLGPATPARPGPVGPTMEARRSTRSLRRRRARRRRSLSTPRNIIAAQQQLLLFRLLPLGRGVRRGPAALGPLVAAGPSFRFKGIRRADGGGLWWPEDRLGAL